MKIKVFNIYLAVKDQMPVARFFKNLKSGDLFGLFHKRSHLRDTGQPKVMYNTKATATKSAKSLSDKHGVHFSHYKCIYCNGYHIGKNRTSLNTPAKMETKTDIE